MKNWDMRVKTVKRILMHIYTFRNDGYLIDKPLDQETKFPK
jgi:hypothetical protein